MYVAAYTHTVLVGLTCGNSTKYRMMFLAPSLSYIITLDLTTTFLRSEVRVSNKDGTAGRE